MEGAEGVVGGGGNSTGSPVAVRISLLCTCIYTCECVRARVCVSVSLYVRVARSSRNRTAKPISKEINVTPM